MIPQSGQHVKCILRNGTTVEGIVDEWSGNQAQLRSFDGKSILIITRPSDDIMLIKIILEDPEEKENILPPKYPAAEVWQNSVETTHDVYDVDHNKSLAELKIDLAAQERHIIAEKLREHRPSIQGAGKVAYEYPGLITKPSIKQHSGQKTTGSSGGSKQRPDNE
jgi:hypothetical protein